MNETATTIGRAGPLPRAREAVRDLDRRVFLAGVAACTAAVAAFLLVQLSGWPPHEDETLPLFVGRQPLGEPLRHRARQARRRPAPLPARLGRRPRGGRPLRDALPLGALRGRERAADRSARKPAGRAGAGAGGDGARGGELGAALPRGLRADVQPLPLPLHALVPRPPARARARRRPRLDALGGRDAARRSAPIRTARSSSARRGCTSC